MIDDGPDDPIVGGDDLGSHGCANVLAAVRAAPLAVDDPLSAERPGDGALHRRHEGSRPQPLIRGHAEHFSDLLLLGLHADQAFVVQLNHVFGEREVLNRKGLLGHQHVITQPANSVRGVELDHELMEPWGILHVHAHQAEIGAGRPRAVVAKEGNPAPDEPSGEFGRGSIDRHRKEHDLALFRTQLSTGSTGLHLCAGLQVDRKDAGCQDGDHDHESVSSGHSRPQRFSSARCHRDILRPVTWETSSSTRRLTALKGSIHKIVSSQYPLSFK